MAKPKRFGSVGNKKSGSWWARYSRNGQWHTPAHVFSAEAAAWAWLRAEQRLIDKDDWTPPARRRAALKAEAEATEAVNVALDTYARRWIANRVTPKGKPLHPRTAEDYRKYLAGPLASLAQRSISSITPADVSAWHAEHASTPSQRHKAYAFLKSVFKTAVEVDELISRNPAQVENATAKPPAKSAEAAVQGLTHAKVRELAELVRPRDRVLVLVLAYCGPRTGEVCALRRSDVELGTGSDGVPFGWLTIARAVSSYDGGRHEGPTKTGDKGKRRIPIPPHLVADLVEHLNEWAEPGESGLIFPSTNPAIAYRTTQQINGRTFPGAKRVGYGWQYAREEIGMPELRLHWLRHWAATLWAEAGTPDSLRRAILGHTQPGMTGGYTHPDLVKAQAYAVKVSELAGWTPPSVGPVAAKPAAAAQNAGPLPGLLNALDDAALIAAIAKMDAVTLAAVVPHLPPERIALVVARLAETR